MRKRIVKAVNDISLGKKLVIIDGVGYPSVGSICGVCNGTVANICNAYTLIIGKAGLGDCIDSWKLSKTYMDMHYQTRRDADSVGRVIGLLVNRVRPGSEWEKSQKVKLYFDGTYNAGVPCDSELFGFVRERDDLFTVDGGSSVNDSSYVPPGEHNECAIAFRAPKPESLTVDALTDQEKAICSGLVEGFVSDIKLEQLKKIAGFAD